MQDKNIETFKKQVAHDTFIPISDGQKDDKRGDSLLHLTHGIKEMMDASHQNNVFQTYVFESLHQFKKPEYYL